jgi:hypothetical protein
LAVLAIGGVAALIAFRGHTPAIAPRTLAGSEPAALVTGPTLSDDHPGAALATDSVEPRAASVPVGDRPSPAAPDRTTARASSPAAAAVVSPDRPVRPQAAKPATVAPSARTAAQPTSSRKVTTDVEPTPAASARRPRTEEEKRAIDHGVVFEEP